jgi:hypothetical protein
MGNYIIVGVSLFVVSVFGLVLKSALKKLEPNEKSFAIKPRRKHKWSKQSPAKNKERKIRDRKTIRERKARDAKTHQEK